MRDPFNQFIVHCASNYPSPTRPYYTSGYCRMSAMVPLVDCSEPEEAHHVFVLATVNSAEGARRLVDAVRRAEHHTPACAQAAVNAELRLIWGEFQEGDYVKVVSPPDSHYYPGENDDPDAPETWGHVGRTATVVGPLWDISGLQVRFGDGTTDGVMHEELELLHRATQ